MTDYCKMSEGLEKLSNKKIKSIFLTAASKTANELLYRMGRKKPHYPVPSTIVHNAESLFAAYYAIALMKQAFKESYN